MLKSILFTHDDLDGAGCRIIFELAHNHLKKGDDYLVLNCHNNTVDIDVLETLSREDVNKDTEICFADIVASREVLEYIVNNFSMPKIWDHHRTNFFATWVVPEATIVPENELGVMQSGTSLIYQYYCGLADDNHLDLRTSFMKTNKETQQFIADMVDTIRSYDTYEWKETNNIEARKLQILFILLGMESFCNYYIDRIINMNKNPLFNKDIIKKEDLKFVDAKLQNEQRIINSITPDDVYHINVRGLNTAFTLGTFGANVSELGNQFLEKYPEFDMFAAFTIFNGGEFSFRCIRDDLDIGKDVALPIGGGGHPKASGASLDNDFREEIINMLINYMNK